MASVKRRTARAITRDSATYVFGGLGGEGREVYNRSGACDWKKTDVLVVDQVTGGGLVYRGWYWDDRKEMAQLQVLGLAETMLSILC